MLIDNGEQFFKEFFENLDNFFLFYEARKHFLKGEDFKDLYYDIKPETEEEAENIYEMKAALAEADARDTAKELIRMLNDLDDTIEEHKDKLGKTLYKLWKRKYERLLNALDHFERGWFDNSEDELRELSRLYRSLAQITLFYDQNKVNLNLD